MIASRNGLLEIVKLLVEAIMRFPEAEKQKALDQTRKVSALYMQHSHLYGKGRRNKKFMSCNHFLHRKTPGLP